MNSLSEDLRIEAEKLAIRFDINYNVALEIVTTGANVAVEHFQVILTSDFKLNGKPKGAE